MSQSKKSSNFIVQGVILGIAAIVVRVLGLLYQMPLTRIIGDMGNGYYSYAYNVYSVLLLISSFSIPIAVSRMVSERMVKHEFRNAQRVFKASMMYVMVIAGICALVTLIFAKQLLPASQSGAVPALRVLAPVIFLAGVLGVLRGYFQGYNTMMPTSFSQIIEGVLNAIVSIFAAYLLVKPFAAGSVKRATYGAVGSTLGTAAGVIVGLLFMGFVYFSYKPTIDKRVRHDRHKEVEDYKTLFKVIVMTVTPVILSSCIYNICPVIDQTLFANILESQKVHGQDISVLQGIYSAKYLKLISVPASIASALSSAIIPAITANMVERDLKAANDKIDRAMKVTMLIAVPSTVGLIVLARPIMLLFGRSTTLVVAVHVLMWGAICVVFNCISTLSNAILQGLNNMRAPMIHSLIALVLHIAACVYFLKRGYGIYALIIATMVFAVVIWILNAIVICRITGYRKLFGNGIVRIVVASVLMGICTFTFYQVCMLLYGKEGMELLFLLLSLVVALLSYLLFLYVVNAFTEEDYDYLPMGARIRSLGVRLRLVETATQPFEEELGELYEEEEIPKKKFIFRKQESVEDDAMDDLMEDTLGMTADDMMGDAGGMVSGADSETGDADTSAGQSGVDDILSSQDAAVQSLLSSLKKESESIQEESVLNLVNGETDAPDTTGDIEIMDISQLLNDSEESTRREPESEEASASTEGLVQKASEPTLDLIDADSILSKYHKQEAEASSKLKEAMEQHRQD